MKGGGGKWERWMDGRGGESGKGGGMEGEEKVGKVDG